MDYNKNREKYIQIDGMMNMNFEWYNPKTGVPSVSIASYGLTFSSGALEALGEPEYVVLGFDEQNMIIGVKACSSEEPKRIPFISKKRSNYVRLSSKDFIRFLESRMPEDFKVESKATKYYSKWDRDNQILKIHLEQPVE